MCFFSELYTLASKFSVMVVLLACILDYRLICLVPEVDAQKVLVLAFIHFILLMHIHLRCSHFS